MSKRVRFWGALLSLLAFSVYSAESVWAAACDPAMESDMDHSAMLQPVPDAGMTAPDGEAMPHDAAHAEMLRDEQAPANSATPPAEADPDGVPCPIAAGTAGSCVSLTLITDSPASRLGGAELSLSGPAPLVHGDRLIATTLFHPPRA